MGRCPISRKLLERTQGCTAKSFPWLSFLLLGHQALQALQVLLLGLGHHVGGQLGGGGDAVQLVLDEPIPQVLLIVAQGGGAHLVLVPVPEAAGIGGEDLVGQHQLAVLVQAKLQLGVGDDDAPLIGVVVALLKQAQAGVFQLLGQLLAQVLYQALVGDAVLIVALGGLVEGVRMGFSSFWASW